MDTINTLGSTFRLARIPAPVIPFVKNSQQSSEVPAVLLEKGITLRLTGNLVIGVANATIFSEAPLGLIRKIELVGDGRRFLVSAGPHNLFRLAHFTWGKQWEIAAPSGVVGTRAFSATIRIDHEALMAINPVESLFDPRLFKKVEVRITWADETAIATAGGGGTIAIDTANTSVDVLAEQVAEGTEQIMFDHTLTGDEQPVVATTRLFKFDIPQNGLLAGIMIRTTRDSGAGAGPVPVDDIINTLTLKSDTTVVHMDVAKWATMQRDNVGKFQLDGGASAGAQIPGYVYIPLLDNGQFSGALNTNELNKLQLILDVTFGAGTQLVQVLYDFFEPRSSLAQQVAAA